MSILTSSVGFENVLKRVFSSSNTGVNNLQYGVDYCNFVKGPYPGSAEISLDPSTTNLSGSTASYPILVANKWSAPSNGISILLSPVSTIVGDGNVNETLTCLKLLWTTSTAGGLFIIPVDTIKGPDNAVVNKVTGINTGDILTLSDLRIKVATEGDFSFNNALANAIVRSIIGASGGGHSDMYLFGCPAVINDSVQPAPRDLFLEIYDCVSIPSSANTVPEDTLLWSRNLSNINQLSSNIFTVTGTTVSYSWPGQSAAVATGTPKYLRIRHPGTQANGYYYPEMILQVPFGVGVGFAPAPATTMQAGQNYALGEFSFIIKP